MSTLDPTGDWLNRGARALDNPRAPSGETSVEELSRLRDDLNENGRRCHTPCLQKVPRGRARRRSRATTRERIPHRQGDRRRPSRGTSRPTGNTGETSWEGNPIGSQRIHSTCSFEVYIYIRIITFS
ncbi:hypothetical protein K1719_035813 [Acacia pycnantha]|nr:hypothetical protein K1719_035813 [Acacia pycnantha]